MKHEFEQQVIRSFLQDAEDWEDAAAKTEQLLPFISDEEKPEWQSEADAFRARAKTMRAVAEPVEHEFGTAENP